MTATVGFYVHHEGFGHAARTAAIARELPGTVTVASSLDLADAGLGGADVVALPTDVPDGPLGDVTANGAFHWTPEHPDTATSRMRAVLDWLESRRPDVVVVDVSVEVACLVRLAGVPVVVVRMFGARDDPAHRLAYRLADALLAPFTAEMEEPGIPAGVRAKTVYCGTIGPSGPASPHLPEPRLRPKVLVVWGRGSPPPPGPVLDEAALSTPDWDWEIVGPRVAVRPPTMVRHHGWVDDVDAVASTADVIVGPPGDGVVALVARTGLPFVALPCDRPFDEQHHHADRLEAMGVALVRRAWPLPGEWPELLDVARTLEPSRVTVLGADGAARRAADAVAAVADARLVVPAGR